MDQTRKQIDVDFDQVMPLLQNEAAAGSPPTTDDDDEDDVIDDDYEAMHRAQMIEQSLLNPAADQALGEWERHTKGFGSKMMQKFGYIIGTGLGSDGRGIVVPISAQILPAGRSLDHCMALREAANGDRNLFSVEKRLKQQHRRQQAASARAYERQTQQVDLFSFMNSRIGGGGGKDGNAEKGSMATATTTTSTTTTTTNFKDHSSKNLNVAGLKISEEIRRLERDIRKLREAQSRHKADTPVYGKLHAQLQDRDRELVALKKSEKSVANEQMFRKDKNKLTIF